MLTGPGGMLGTLAKMVLQKALAAEKAANLGYEARDPACRDSGNSRNGVRSKTVITKVGPVEIDVPRDRDGSFTPKLVGKRQRRLAGVEELVASLVAKVHDRRGPGASGGADRCADCPHGRDGACRTGDVGWCQSLVGRGRHRADGRRFLPTAGERPAVGVRGPYFTGSCGMRITGGRCVGGPRSSRRSPSFVGWHPWPLPGPPGRLRLLRSGRAGC